MRWYDYVILKFPKYRLFVFIPLIIAFCMGVVVYKTEESFLGLIVFLILFGGWCLFWLIASYFYLRNLKK